MLKIGALSFVNSLPFFYPFIERKIDCDSEFIFNDPCRINELLHKGSCDIALISSKSFLENREQYILLTNLGIATTKKSISVCLFIKGPISDLDGRIVLIPDASATSVALLNVLCHNFWNVKPRFRQVSFEKIHAIHHDKDVEGFLVIGDECFKMLEKQQYRAIDLASAWHEYTKKSFVFAMFATRLETWLQKGQEVLEFHNKLTNAFEYSLNHTKELIQYAAEKSNVTPEILNSYYKTLDFQLDPRHFHGLELFVSLSNKIAQKNS